jgi:hypothetical protein
VRSLEFHPEAQAELIAAAHYFEGEAENLGLDFIDFVQRAAIRLLRFPTRGRRVGRRLRRVVVPCWRLTMNRRLSAFVAELYASGVAHDAAQPDRLLKHRNLELSTADLLSLTVRMAGARRVVEIGTANGYSTIWLAMPSAISAGTW